MRANTYDICIVGGLGHVGLPLGLSFAAKGQRVVLYDVNETAVKDLRKGKMPFREAGAEEVLTTVLNRHLSVTTDRTVIRDSHFLIVTIGTPIDDHLTPHYRLLEDFLDGVTGLLRGDQHIILRSTILPRTTERVARYLSERGKAVKVSFCPERIAEGKAMSELHDLPQIISSTEPEGLDEVRRLFSLLTKDIIVLNPVEAELAKLLTNVWRYILFAIANQFYEIAARENVDFYRVYKAMVYKYPRMSGFPRAGFAAGPCLFKDTMQLAAFSDNNFFLGHAAMLINEGLPNFVVQQIKSRHPLATKTVGILGMAFKADSDDKRASLSYKLRALLEAEAKRVLCSDVYIQEPGLVSMKELVRQSDIIILGVPHQEYGQLDFGHKTVVDIWNCFGRDKQP